MTAKEMVMTMIANRISSLEEEIDTLRITLEDKEEELNRLTNALKRMENED